MMLFDQVDRIKIEQCNHNLMKLTNQRSKTRTNEWWVVMSIRIDLFIFSTNYLFENRKIRKHLKQKQKNVLVNNLLFIVNLIC